MVERGSQAPSLCPISWGLLVVPGTLTLAIWHELAPHSHCHCGGGKVEGKQYPSPSDLPFSHSAKQNWYSSLHDPLS